MSPNANSNATDWEKFENEPAGEIVKAENKDKTNWEVLENEAENVLAVDSDKVSEELVDEEEDWLTFSDEELDEMKALEKESRGAHEKWVEEARRSEAELAERSAQARQKEQAQVYEDEKRMREQLLEDMRKAEDERRKKLLEDAANSFQSSDSKILLPGQKT